MLLLVLDHGESDWIAEIYGLHGGELLRVAYNILGSRELAEDALQAAFVRIMNQPELLRRIPRHKQLAYVVVVVRNQALNDYKRGKRRRAEPLEEMAYALPAREDTEALALHREEVGELLAAIKTLPDSLRLPLLLRYGEAQPYRRIAELLDISQALARKRVQRAIEQLRKEAGR